MGLRQSDTAASIMSLQQAEDVNVLVVDTEVYSNTGGQASKGDASRRFRPVPVIREKERQKGSRSSNDDIRQRLCGPGFHGRRPRATHPGAERGRQFPRPLSCHRICTLYRPRNQSGNAVRPERNENGAVQAGYWHLYRYNPLHAEHPFTLDSKEPTFSFEGFLDGETRYAALRRTFPENAKVLFERAAREAKEKYLYYKRLEDNSCL